MKWTLFSTGYNNALYPVRISLNQSVLSYIQHRLPWFSTQWHSHLTNEIWIFTHAFISFWWKLYFTTTIHWTTKRPCVLHSTNTPLYRKPIIIFDRFCGVCGYHVYKKTWTQLKRAVKCQQETTWFCVVAHKWTQ